MLGGAFCSVPGVLLQEKVAMSEFELMCYELEVEALIEADPERAEVENQGLDVVYDPELGWEDSPTTCG